MNIISGKQAFKLSLIVAPLGIIFVFFVYGLQSSYERRSDKFIEAEFNSANIDSVSVYEYKGFSTDIIFVNDEKYFLNLNMDFKDEKIGNLKNYQISKRANSDMITIENIQEKKMLKLWSYNKTKYWIKRILFSLFGGLFFIFVGILNLQHDKNNSKKK